MGSDQHIVNSAGGIVYDASGNVLVIKRKLGGYGLPKGHVEPGETAEQAAVRELFEETGYHCDIVHHLGVVRRKSREDDGRIADKDIDLFYMTVAGGQLGSTEEDPVWVPYDEALEGLFHPEERTFLAAHDARTLGLL